MFASFQEYWAERKPRLDEAFRNKIGALLANIPLRESAALNRGLENGKKIRGCLTCLISDALGGALESAIPRAVAVEIIQAATLIHDDYVDQDRTRRNLPAAWTLEGGRRAVLIGDVLFADAIKMMSDLGREDGSAISGTIAQVSRGALHEPLDPVTLAEGIESNRLKPDFYERIIKLKTGVLFGTACFLGALAAEANRSVGEACFKYGMLVGEAYQIADDLKEVELYLERKTIRPDQMAALAPALIHFSGALCPPMLSILKGEDLGFDDGNAASLQLAATLMRSEIHRRLERSLSDITGAFPPNGYSSLVRQAPWDLIRMFNETL